MFRMYGRTVEVLHYKIDYTEDEEQRTDYAATEDEANEIAKNTGGVVSALSASDDEWMDGMEVDDVPDTYGEAMRIYGLGESAYTAEMQAAESSTSAQLRADIDYIMLMGGY